MDVMERFRLDGDVVMVTGGASGIGEQYATACAEAGADVVVLADIDEDAATATAEEIEDATDATVEGREVDVTDKPGVDEAVDAIVDDHGSLDVAFANAGIAELESQIGNYPEDQWRRILDVNLDGVFYTARAAAEQMVEQDDGGAIVNTASVYGLVSSDILGTMFAYATSKGGVVNMTRALGAELAPQGVRVNAIAPSHVRTSLAGGFLQEDAPAGMENIQEEIEDDTPMDRISEAEELKGPAVFLASDASSYCTGYTYAVDGGWLAL